MDSYGIWFNNPMETMITWHICSGNGNYLWIYSMVYGILSGFIYGFIYGLSIEIGFIYDLY